MIIHAVIKYHHIRDNYYANSIGIVCLFVWMGLTYVMLREPRYRYIKQVNCVWRHKAIIRNCVLVLRVIIVKKKGWQYQVHGAECGIKYWQ